MLYIRADMNNVIATGHIMRCLAIANEAIKLGWGVTFILADAQATKILNERRIPYIILETAWNDMESELEKLQEIIRERNIRVLLIDSYMVTQKYLQILSTKTRIVYIDDLNSFKYPVHTLICYANYWEKFSYEEIYRDTMLLLGPDYVPLRDAFCHCGAKEIKPCIEYLILLSGGTDQYYILENLLKNMKIKEYKNIDVICGRYYEKYDQLCTKFSRFPQVQFHKEVPDIEVYMGRADMAVSAGGTTLYELCACGVPTISYSFADNQLDSVLQFQKDNLIAYAGDVRYTNIYDNVGRLLEQYFSNITLRKQCSEKMQNLIDGMGASRIVKALLGIS